MMPSSSRFLNGVLCALLVSAVAAACGSDSTRRHVRAEEGGAGGAGGEPSGGAKAQVGGNGGEPIVTGGAGGVPAVTAGEGGMLVIAIGGVPSAGEGGAAGAPDTLPPIDCDAIVFEDATLENAVRYQLDILPGEPITAQAASVLTTLGSSQFSGITSLSGIECFSNLTDLYLGMGGAPSTITDLSPLRYLTKLTKLDLNNNPLESLEPLGKLPNLEQLDLTRALDGVDLTPLASAPKLADLRLYQTTVGDLAPLGNIATLVHIDLGGATLTAPATVSALQNVKTLEITAALSDATPLAALTQLITLDVSSKALTNFDKLSTLVNLTSLKAESAGITSATAVGAMTKLTYLDLAFNQVADITPLQGLTQLSSLFLNFNPVTDIAPLVNNAGVAGGDTIYLTGTSLNCQAQTTNVTTLVGRGATVFSPCN